jgi:hypothetical protein
VVFDGAQQRRRVARLCDDFEAGPLEKLRECLADQGRIVGQHQAQRHDGATSARRAAGESEGQR